MKSEGMCVRMLMVGVSLATAYPLRFYIGGDFEGQRWGTYGHVAQCSFTTDLRCWNMGEGLKGGRVNAIAANTSRSVYATGSFYDASKAIAYVARWDGSEWVGVGKGLEGGVGRTLAVSGQSLYVGGDFVKAGGQKISFVAVWDGDAWHGLTPDGTSRSGLGGQVNSLAVLVGGGVVVGGSFLTVGGDSAMQFLSVWSPKTREWVQPDTRPFPHEVVAVAASRAAKHQAVWAAGRFDLRRYSYEARSWMVNLKRPRKLPEAFFRIRTSAVGISMVCQVYGTELVSGFNCECDPCTSMSEPETDQNGIKHVTRWCRSSLTWEPVPEIHLRRHIYALAPSANGEMVVGGEKTVALYNNTLQLMGTLSMEGIVTCASTAWDPQTPIKDATPVEQVIAPPVAELEVGEEGEEESGWGDERGEGIAIPRRGDKAMKEFTEALKDSVYGVRVVNSWDQLDAGTPQGVRKKGEQIHRSIADLQLEAEASEATDNDIEVFEDADSIIIDKAELEHIERIRAVREREEKRERIRMKRYDRSPLVKLCRLCGVDLAGKVEFDTLELVDDLLTTGFFLGQILLLILITWIATSKVDRWLGL